MRACVRARPQLIPLRRKVPVPRTEEAFVFQSQRVETGGRWRGDGKEEQDEKAERRSRTANRYYLYGGKKTKKTFFTAAVRRDGQRAKSNNRKSWQLVRDAQRRHGDD